jgi:dephospho-CoA kinase
MIVVGLTGSIAMGKSTTAQLFAALGVPVCDADTVVHTLYDQGGAAVAPVGALFPDALEDGRIDRTKLLAHLTADPDGFPKLEAIVHPLVRKEEDRFLKRCRESGAKVAVLDIPLLFEAGRDRDVDKIVVVSAPADIQRARALARPGMTEERFQALLARQVPDAEKRARADFVVDSSRGLEGALEQVRAIVAELAADSDR